MTALKLLACVGAVSVIVGLLLASFPVLIIRHPIGDMGGAGFHPSQFAMEAHMSGLVVLGVGVVLLIVAGIIYRLSD
jgi:hypothetical protein